jgi:predicted metal-dependent hydrolase
VTAEGPSRLQTIEYFIRRSARARRTRITVEQDGTVMVTLPMRAPERHASELVEARRAWLERHLVRIRRERARLRQRPELGAGREVSYAGEPHDVIAVTLPRSARRSRVSHHDRPYPTILIELATGDERPLGDILEAWLRAEAKRLIQRRVAVRARDLGVEPGRITVRDQRSRWGSASRTGTVSFSWRLVLAPAWVLDAIVVHELAHLVRFDHSARFWRLVGSVTPHGHEARRWLREHETELRAALD